MTGNLEAAKIFNEISETNTQIANELRDVPGKMLETMVAQLHATVALGIARILMQLDKLAER